MSVRSGPPEGAAILTGKIEEAGALEAILLISGNVGAGPHTLETRAGYFFLTILDVKGERGIFPGLVDHNWSDEELVGVLEIRVVTTGLHGTRHAEAKLVGTIERVVGVKSGAAVTVRAGCNGDFVAILVKRTLRHVIHNATEVAYTVEQRCRTPHHFDTSDVGGISRMLTAETIAEHRVGDETAHLNRCLGFRGGGSFAAMHSAFIHEGIALAGVVLGLKNDTRAVTQGFTEIRRTRVLHELLSDHLDRHRDIFDQRV